MEPAAWVVQLVSKHSVHGLGLRVPRRLLPRASSSFCYKGMQCTVFALPTTSDYSTRAQLSSGTRGADHSRPSGKQ